ncbi:MAG: MBL fold metallo-hydrolase [Proteobacteria bacterium]|nr:MBL fold metallo-hydrolase [Pseudomonadota bacterium]
MYLRQRCLLAAGLCSAAFGAGAQAPASEATVARHVAEATRLAGSDLTALMVLCKPAPAARMTPAQGEAYLSKMINQPVPEPGRAFDNLYYVGAKWVSAWAITTPQGIILIDALNNKAEAATVIEGGMARLGLDPRQIRYVISTHGHGDHYGGANYLVERYRPRVVMSALDWTMTETKLEFESPLWDAPPKRDIAVSDGDKVTLGGTTVTMHITPGHTLGAISPTFEVKSNGTTHKVMLWGGTSFNFGKDIPRMNGYIESTRKMAKIVQEQGIDVMLSNHSSYDGSLPKLEAYRRQKGAEPNPFVMGTPAVLRALGVMGECAQAQRDRFLMQP